MENRTHRARCSSSSDTLPLHQLHAGVIAILFLRKQPRILVSELTNAPAKALEPVFPA